MESESETESGQLEWEQGTLTNVSAFQFLPGTPTKLHITDSTYRGHVSIRTLLAGLFFGHSLFLTLSLYSLLFCTENMFAMHRHDLNCYRKLVLTIMITDSCPKLSS